MPSGCVQVCSLWGPVPTNYYDALRYGRDMALALLRVAPLGTGESVLEGFFGPSAEDALACYDRVVATGAPFLDPVPFTAPSGRHVMEETIFLPLSDDGINVNKILVFSHSRDHKPSAFAWRQVQQ